MAVKKLPGVTDVLVDVTAETPAERLAWSDWNCRCQNILAISSGKGGVGRVQLPSMLPLAQSGAKVGLLDADIYGPNAPMLGSTQITVRQGEQGEVLEPALITASNWFQWAFN